MYVAATIVLTWPLARGMTHDIPGDFGDPLFTMWVLSWDVTHLGAGWWNANIFHPHPLTLAYSEHFLPQALTIAPVYYLTRNPILCYNLLFLSTFVLCGLGMFLFARELTGDPIAAVVAGFAYAFTPYRIGNAPHLQVLSAAWLPFALFGLRRFFVTGRLRPLAGAMVAWFVQNLSCGYYLLFLSPIVALYAGWELTVRRQWMTPRVAGAVAAASATTLGATAWFISPYAELRRLGFKPRALSEVAHYSADVYAYFTADPNLRLWGPLAQAWPHPEGWLFPGLTIVALSGIAVAAAWRRARARATTLQRHPQRQPERLATALRWLLGIAAALVVYLLFGFQVRTPILRITSLSRQLWIAAILGTALIAVSARARSTLRGWIESAAGCFSIVCGFAIVMSFGPMIQAKGDLVTHSSLYTPFYYYAPGFDGVRVPARFATAVGFSLAGLCALAMTTIAADKRRRIAAAAIVFMTIEAIEWPIPVNQNPAGYTEEGLAPLPPYVSIGADLPAVYRQLAQLPSSAVVVELPLGEPAFDVRYMFYSTFHWRRLVNGYSGGAPDEYGQLDLLLKDGGTALANAALRRTGATHAVVHEGFYTNDRGSRLSSWLRANGAHEIWTSGRDRLFQLH